MAEIREDRAKGTPFHESPKRLIRWLGGFFRIAWMRINQIRYRSGVRMLPAVAGTLGYFWIDDGQALGCSDEAEVGIGANKIVEGSDDI
jgi:hypothetical protein